MANARYVNRTLLMLVLCVGAQAMNEASRRMLDYDPLERHSVPPPDQVADPEFPSTDKTLLMSTPCHPEADGYFGGTSGQPITLKYGFLMETAIHGDIDTALEAIDEFVMDSILSNTFPEVCGDKRRLIEINESGRATGFKFESESIDMERSCEPTASNMNYCAVYSGNIMMYGRDLAYYDTAETVLGYARDAIYSSLSTASEYGVVRLIVDDELTQMLAIETGDGNNQYAEGIAVTPPNWGASVNEDGDRFSPGAKFGLTISVLALIASLVGFFLYIRLDQKDGSFTRRARASPFFSRLQSLFGSSDNQGKAQKDGSFTERARASPFLSRLQSHFGSSDNRGRATTDSNRYSDEVEPSLHVHIGEDGRPEYSQFESSMSVSTKRSVTGSSRSEDPLKQPSLAGEESNDVNSFLNEPNDLDSFLNEPNDVDSFLNDPGDAHSYLSSLADSSVILPDDDPEDDMYLDAFR